MTRVASIVVGGGVAPWNDFGFITTSVNGRVRCSLGDVSLLIDSSLPPGLRHLEIVGCPFPVDNFAGLPVVHVDELRTHDSTSTSTSSDAIVSPRVVSVVGVDHVVVLADDVRATCAEIERQSGSPLKRVKESDRGVQGFHRLGSVILEVVERRLVQPGETSSNATYWGFVVIVDNLDAVVEHLGPDVAGAAKPAVQTGRRIATVRSGAGLGVPLALMSR